MWNLIAQSKDFRKLSTAEKQRIRDLFIQNVALPVAEKLGLTKEELEELKARLKEATDPDVAPSGITGILQTVAQSPIALAEDIARETRGLLKFLGVKEAEDSFLKKLEEEILPEVREKLNLPYPVTTGQKVAEFAAEIPLLFLDPYFKIAELPAKGVLKLLEKSPRIVELMSKTKLGSLLMKALPHAAAGFTFETITGAEPKKAAKEAALWGAGGVVLEKLGEKLGKIFERTEGKVSSEIKKDVEAAKKAAEVIKSLEEPPEKKILAVTELNNAKEQMKKKAKTKVDKVVAEVVDKEISKLTKGDEDIYEELTKEIKKVMAEEPEIVKEVKKTEVAEKETKKAVKEVTKKEENLDRIIKELKQKGFTESQLKKAKPETIKELHEKGYSPKEVSILPSGELRVIEKPAKAVEKPIEPSDRTRTIFLGRLGKRKIIFEDPLLARAFDAGVSNKKALFKNLPDEEAKKLFKFVRSEEEAFKKEGIEEPEKLFSAVYEKVVEKAKKSERGKELEISWDDLPQYKKALKKVPEEKAVPEVAEKVEKQEKVEESAKAPKKPSEKPIEKPKPEPEWQPVDYKELKAGDYVKTTYKNRTVEGTLGETVKKMRTGYVARELIKLDGRKTWVAWTPKAQWWKKVGEKVEEKAEEKVEKLYAGVPVPEGIRKAAKELYDLVINWIAPTAKSKEAELTASIYRKKIGPANLFHDTFLEETKNIRRIFYSFPKEKVWEYYDLIEKGKVSKETVKELLGVDDKTASELVKLGAVWRVVADKLWKELKDRGMLNEYIEQYLPHIYKNEEKATGVLRNYFLKKRKIPTYKEALEMGLEPRFDNPVDLMSQYIFDVTRLLSWKDTIKELKERDLAKWIRKAKEVPEGWIKIKGEETPYGAYYAPEDVARILNNIRSKGLYGKSTVYDAMRTFNNYQNAVNLGISAFHGTFTAVTDMANSFAIALSKFLRGKIIEGLKEMAEATPFGVYKHYKKGSRLAYILLHPEEIKTEWEREFYRLAKKANVSAKLDRYYKLSAVENLIKDIKKNKPLSAALRFPLAVVEYAAKPIMEKLVPNLKLISFAKLAEEEILRQQPKTEDELIMILSKVYDMIEDRFGQLTYDNLFWHRTLKDLLMISLRSVGWNYGDIRELAGAGRNIGEIVEKLLKGEKVKPKDISNRLLFVISLPIVVGMYGAVINYLLGQKPEKLYDYFFIKTGRRTPSGAPERILIASYIKDWLALKEEKLLTMLKNKASPLINDVIQLIQNKDYWGREIYSPDDGLDKILKDAAKYLVKSFIPFSLQGVARREEAGETTWRKYLPLFGIIPAPTYATATEAEKYILEKFRQTKGKVFREAVERLEEKREVAKLWRQGKKKEAIRKLKEMIKEGKMTLRGAKMYLNILKQSDPILYFFRRLDPEVQVKALEKMSKEEFKKYFPYANIRAKRLYIKEHGKEAVANGR